MFKLCIRRYHFAFVKPFNFRKTQPRSARSNCEPNPAPSLPKKQYAEIPIIFCRITNKAFASLRTFGLLRLRRVGWLDELPCSNLQGFLVSST
jgi:hypothetical protein